MWYKKNMNKNDLKYACLFGGGAIRGMAHIGVVRALNEIGVGLGTLAGSSVGAIVAAALAVGYSDEELEKIFLDVDFELFRDINFSKSLALSKGDIFLDWMREIIETKFYGVTYSKGKNKPVTFADIEKNCVIITTDLTNFCCKEFSREATPDFEIAEAVRISACMPGLMKAIEVGDVTLVDGDLQKSWPMWKLCNTLANLKENILEIRLEGTPCGDLTNPISFINSVYSCITSVASEFVVNLYERDETHDCLVVNTGDVVIVNFQMKEAERKALIEDGYNQTIAYFKNILPKKKAHLLDNYIKIKNFIVDIRDLIIRDKVCDAQVKFGNLLALLCDIKYEIDEKIYYSIKDLTENILNNSGKTFFLKQTYLKDFRSVVKHLDELEQELRSKQDELQSLLQNLIAN